MAEYNRIYDAIENSKEKILAAERFIWSHIETGFREWNTHSYIKEHFESIGYVLHEAGNIPGFYTDIDTGVPGPKIAVFADINSFLPKGDRIP